MKNDLLLILLKKNLFVFIFVMILDIDWKKALIMFNI